MFLAGPNTCQQLLNWMLAIACQQGHLDIVKLLIRAYSADPESCAVRRNEFPVLIRLPLYAAIKAGVYLHVFAPSLPGLQRNGWAVHTQDGIRGLSGVGFPAGWIKIKLALNLLAQPDWSQGLVKLDYCKYWVAELFSINSLGKDP